MIYVKSFHFDGAYSKHLIYYLEFCEELDEDIIAVHSPNLGVILTKKTYRISEDVLRAIIEGRVRIAKIRVKLGKYRIVRR